MSHHAPVSAGTRATHQMPVQRAAGRLPASAQPEELPPVPTPRTRGITVQHVVLAVGVLLVLAAGSVFIALQEFGPVQQILLLTGATALVFAVAVGFDRRTLRQSAEAMAITGGALLALDLSLSFAFDLYDIQGGSGQMYAAITLGILAVVTGALSLVAPRIRALQVQFVLAPQAIPLLIGLSEQWSPAWLAVTAAAQSFVILALTHRCGGIRRPMLLTGRISSVAVFAAGSHVLIALTLSGCWGSPFGSQRWTGPLGLVICGAIMMSVIQLRWLPATASLSGFRIAAWSCMALGASALVIAVTQVGPWVTTGALAIGLACWFAASARPKPRQAALAISCFTSAWVPLLATALLTDLQVLLPVAMVLVAGMFTVLAVRGLVESLTGLIAVTSPLMLAANPTTTHSLALTGVVWVVIGSGVLTLAASNYRKPVERTAMYVATLIFAGAITAMMADPAAFDRAGRLGVAALAIVPAIPLIVMSRRDDRSTYAGVVAGMFTLSNLIAWDALGVTTVEAYTLPTAAFMLLASIRITPASMSSWRRFVPSLVVGLLPSTVMAVMNLQDWNQLAVALTLGIIAVVGGVGWRQQAPFVQGVLALLVMVVAHLYPEVARMSLWIPLAVAGFFLLGIGATYERRFSEAKSAVAWVRSLR